jgi:tetratricopeptide (TPR) repeat protein
VRAGRAYILLARDEVEAALSDWEQAMAIARRSEIPDEVVSFLAAGAHLCSQLGRPAQARALADEVLGYDAEAVAAGGLELAWIADHIGRSAQLRAKLYGAPAVRPWFRQIADLVLAGDFATAADLAHDWGLFSIEAETRLRAADKLRDLGRHDEANKQLEKALAFYRTVGARRYIRESEGLLSTSV